MHEEKKVVILSGGFSEEADVSLMTASEIGKSLEKLSYNVEIADPRKFSSYTELCDFIKKEDPLIVFNGLHGTAGEDGRIQSLFELENIRYTGSGSRASAIAMDKHISGNLAVSESLLIPRRIIIEDMKAIDLTELVEKIDFPLVVKPNDSGSSVGITIVQKKSELKTAVETAFKYSKKVIAEKFIPGRELTVTVLDGKALPVVEIKPKNGWYDYTNKYTAGNTVYVAPAELDDEIETQIKIQAEKIFRLFGCSVYARIDFRYDGENLYFLEANTLPGMTQLSLTPMAAKADGISFEQLLEKIIEFSIRRFNDLKGD